MKILVTGATGMVGSEVVRQAILDTDIEEVVALVRRPLPPLIPPQKQGEKTKLRVVEHRDFLNYTGLEAILRSVDACLWCLGISQAQVSKEEYHVITYDYTMAAAKALLAANPEITFIFVSGLGADPTQKSRFLFARVKGKTETALRELPFKRLYIARPGGIKPAHPKKHTPWVERIWLPLFPFFNWLRPDYFITSEELAKGMLGIVKRGSPNTIIGNAELKNLNS